MGNAATTAGIYKMSPLRFLLTTLIQAVSQIILDRIQQHETEVR